jgi:hypothetical protein
MFRLRWIHIAKNSLHDSNQAVAGALSIEEGWIFQESPR